MNHNEKPSAPEMCGEARTKGTFAEEQTEGIRDGGITSTVLAARKRRGGKGLQVQCSRIRPAFGRNCEGQPVLIPIRTLWHATATRGAVTQRQPFWSTLQSKDGTRATTLAPMRTSAPSPAPLLTL